jgi:hypothetical protein
MVVDRSPVLLHSPIIVEKDGKYSSFFPGLKADQAGGIKTHLIEPLGIHGRQEILLLRTRLIEGQYRGGILQAIILCDQAGNILSVDRLLKQETADAVLAFIKNRTQTTLCAVRERWRLCRQWTEEVFSITG